MKKAAGKTAWVRIFASFFEIRINGFAAPVASEYPNTRNCLYAFEDRIAFYGAVIFHEFLGWGPSFLEAVFFFEALCWASGLHREIIVADD